MYSQRTVPPGLGYGRIRSGNIPGNSGLIFDVELLAVNP
ncbi:MAG: FKBP-type peptidyl-prolyl cis-trans isomerase [Opitutales bacterium]